MINKVTLVGNLGKDAIVRYTQSGLAIANMSVATTEKWKDRDTGEGREKTEWHRVTTFGPMAEVVGKLYKKGRQVYVEGALQTRKWHDEKAGVDRWTTEIKSSLVKLLGPAPERRPEPAYETAGDPPGSGGMPAPVGPDYAGYSPEDDIPF